MHCFEKNLKGHESKCGHFKAFIIHWNCKSSGGWESWEYNEGLVKITEYLSFLKVHTWYFVVSSGQNFS